MRTFILLIAATSMAVPAVATAHGDRYGSRYDQGQREWRGSDGRYYCRKSDGTVGLVIGAAGGALLGRAVDSRGSRATGTILGAAAGALLGREVAKKRRCR